MGEIEYVDILVPLENVDRVLFTFNWGDRWEHRPGDGFNVEIVQRIAITLPAS